MEQGSPETSSPEVIAALRALDRYDRPTRDGLVPDPPRGDRFFAELVERYLASDEAVRSEIRGYYSGRIWEASRRIAIEGASARAAAAAGDPSAAGAALHRFLVALSILNRGVDYREILDILDDIRRRAADLGVDVDAIARDAITPAGGELARFLDGTSR